MKARALWVRVSIGAGALIMLGTGAWWLRSLSEPRHAGVTFSSWMRRAVSEQGSIGGLSPESYEAFEAMRPKSVTLLLGHAFSDRTDSAVQRGWQNVWNRLPEPVRKRLPEPRSVNQRKGSAGWVLAKMHLRARELLPRIEGHLQGSNLMHRRQATFLLGSVSEGKEEAAQALRPLLKDTDLFVRQLALQGMQQFGPAAAVAIDEIMETARDPATRRRALVCLGQLGSAAAPAIPMLEELLDPGLEESLTLSVAETLLRINPAHEAALAVFLGRLTDVSASERRAVLGRAAGLASANPRICEALVEVLDESDYTVWHYAVQGVFACNEHWPRAQEVLERKLIDSNAHNRFQAAAWLLQKDPKHAWALDFLERSSASGSAVTRGRALSAALSVSHEEVRHRLASKLQADVDPSIRKRAREAGARRQAGSGKGEG